MVRNSARERAHAQTCDYDVFFLDDWKGNCASAGEGERNLHPCVPESAGGYCGESLGRHFIVVCDQIIAQDVAVVRRNLITSVFNATLLL